MPDRERRDAALALIDRLDEHLGDVDRLLVDWRTDVALLPSGASRTAILTLTRSYSEQLGDVAREVGRLAFELRRYITAAEWPRVFPAPTTKQERNGPC